METLAGDTTNVVLYNIYRRYLVLFAAPRTNAKVARTMTVRDKVLALHSYLHSACVYRVTPGDEQRLISTLHTHGRRVWQLWQCIYKWIIALSYRQTWLREACNSAAVQHSGRKTLNNNFSIFYFPYQFDMLTLSAKSALK